MATPDHAREPCPDRILDDIGGAFGMGAVGGSIYHFVRGVYNSPKGERFVGGTQGVRMNAPRVGGSFAVWGGLFSTFDCSMVYLRQKEDPWNSIAAGAATGGFLQLRAGLRSATRSAIFGGVLLAMIEGAGIMLNRLMAPPPPPVDDQLPQMGFPSNAMPLPTPMSPRLSEVPASPQVPATESSSSWFGFFGGKPKEEEHPIHAEKLDSFDANPAPPIPGFEIKYRVSLDGGFVGVFETVETTPGSQLSRQLREYDAIVVTDATIYNDLLLVSSELGAKQPLRIVLARSLDLPIDAQVFDTSIAPDTCSHNRKCISF